METTIKYNEKILKRDTSALLLIDIQEKILAVMDKPEQVVNNSLKLIKGFKILNIPIFYTEQYPKGLGNTSAILLKELEGLSAIQKMTFSCSGAGNLFPRLKDNNAVQVIVAGIESHVCVQQTVLDLLANGFQVNLAVDAVSSRSEFDYKIAIDRMRHHGAEITTTEAILFELLNICGTEEFKSISRIVK
ncbi:MAG TPA: hydrolase [Ignavibacteriaceae bacterium]|nr:hydrolase [Ignavibacteriaceae bacterium]